MFDEFVFYIWGALLASLLPYGIFLLACLRRNHRAKRRLALTLAAQGAKGDKDRPSDNISAQVTPAAITIQPGRQLRREKT